LCDDICSGSLLAVSNEKYTTPWMFGNFSVPIGMSKRLSLESLWTFRLILGRDDIRHISEIKPRREVVPSSEVPLPAGEDEIVVPRQDNLVPMRLGLEPVDIPPE
jgi:hypothetical protein